MKILNIGSMNIDYVYAVPHFVRQGETLSSTDRQVLCGGKGLNQSIALARARLTVYHAGCVGEDGGMLVRSLAENGVDVSLIRRCAEKTGHAIIQVDAAGQNCILLYGGANLKITGAYIDEALSGFSAGDILLVQNEVNLVDHMIRKAKSAGMRVAVNPAPMNENMRLAPLDLADMLFLNEVEAEDLCGAKDPMEQLAALRARYPKAALVLTLGEQGSLYQGPGGEIFRQGAYNVPAVDTTAAGDTYIAYFLAGLAAGHDVPACLRMAAKAAAITVCRMGAAASVPRMEEVQACNLAFRSCVNDA
ncbi:MAG: ribokinase [Firmicutes bacterium]|nr:ribokinase [Bacillota bacterium]